MCWLGWGVCALPEEIGLGLTGYRSPEGPPKQIYLFGSGAYIALDKINNDSSILRNHTLSFMVADSGCSEKEALGAVVNLVRNGGVLGIIGPACTSANAGAGKLGSLWNVPVIAYSGTGEALSDKSVFDTFSRTVSTTFAGGQLVASTVHNMNWKHACIFYSYFTPFLHTGFMDKAKKLNMTAIEPILGRIMFSSRTELRDMFAVYKEVCRGECFPFGLTSLLVCSLEASILK